MPPLDAQRCLGGMKTVKAAGRDSIRAGSFSQAICILRRNMGGEWDQVSQSAFSSPVQGLLGLCIWSLWSSVHNGSFALKICMAAYWCHRKDQHPSDNNSWTKKKAGVFCRGCLGLQISPSTYCRLLHISMYLQHPQSAWIVLIVIHLLNDRVRLYSLL